MCLRLLVVNIVDLAYKYARFLAPFGSTYRRQIERNDSGAMQEASNLT